MQNNGDYLAPPPVEGVGGGGTGYGWNDSSLKSSVTIARVIDVSRQPTADLLHVWCMPSTATIGHQEPPRPLEQISLLAARNERESAQIALRPKISWTGDGMAGHVQIHCSDLCSSSGHKLQAGKEVTLRRVVPVLGVPDALIPVELPTSRVGLLPGETSALWVSVDVPASQPPGFYAGEICVTAMRPDTDCAVGEKVECEKGDIKKGLQGCLREAEAGISKSPQELVRLLSTWKWEWCSLRSLS